MTEVKCLPFREIISKGQVFHVSSLGPEDGGLSLRKDGMGWQSEGVVYDKVQE